MNSVMTPLLFSLRPRYANLVFEGLKKFELRRRGLTLMKGREVFVYVTSPVGKLRGGFQVGEVRTGTPEEIWEVVANSACIERADFDAYYAGRSIAFALEITEVWEYSDPVGLSELRGMFQNFVAPQSWRYVKPEEHELFLQMERDGLDKEITLETKGTWPSQTSPLPQGVAG